MQELKRAVRHFVENPRYLFEDGIGVIALFVMAIAFLFFTA